MNNQYNQQPQYQQQYAPQPQMPMIDPMIAKQQKKDAFNALSDKIAAFMQTNPVLKVIASFSDLISYFVIGIVLVMSILVMALQGYFSMITSTALSAVAVLFGVLSLSKKSILPLTITLSVLTCFNLINFILNIVTLAKWSGGASGSMVITFICSIFDMLIIGGFAALAWTYFLAMLPPKVYQPRPYGGQPMQQPYNGQPMQQPMQQQPVQQPVQQPMQQPAPVPVQKTCPACGSANTDDADFCKICGSKL